MRAVMNPSRKTLGTVKRRMRARPPGKLNETNSGRYFLAETMTNCRRVGAMHSITRQAEETGVKQGAGRAATSTWKSLFCRDSAR